MAVNKLEAFSFLKSTLTVGKLPLMTVIYFSKQHTLSRLENKAYLLLKITAFELPLLSLA